MRRSSTGLAAVMVLNLCVCHALGCLPIAALAMLLLLAGMARPLPRAAFLLPGVALVWSRWSVGAFFGATVILMQLWSILRAESGRRFGGREFVERFCATTWFASLPSGPIHRDPELLRSLRWPPRFDREVAVELGYGFYSLCTCVFFTNHFVAIPAKVAESGFFSLVVMLISGVLILYLQLSGFAAVAIGVSRAFGVVLPPNFDAPWRAADISDFWRRWHMSLYQWFFNEIYFPLSMKVAGFVSGQRAVSLVSGALVFLTACLVGLWHGSDLTYLLWGAGNGILLVLLPRLIPESFARKLASWVSIIFLFSLFRFPGLSAWSAFLGRLPVFSRPELEGLLRALLIFALTLAPLGLRGPALRVSPALGVAAGAFFVFLGLLWGTPFPGPVYIGF